MATKLDKTIKRELDMDGQAYTVAISPAGIKITQKGYRKGREMTWKPVGGWAGGRIGRRGNTLIAGEYVVCRSGSVDGAGAITSCGPVRPTWLDRSRFGPLAAEHLASDAFHSE